MRYPSIKTIQTRLGIDRTAARVLRKVIDGSYDREFEGCGGISGQYYDPPDLDQLRMIACNMILDGYGVESYRARDESCVKYVNMGDTYTMTVINHGSKWYIMSWGDYYETRRKL